MQQQPQDSPKPDAAESEKMEKDQMERDDQQIDSPNRLGTQNENEEESQNMAPDKTEFGMDKNDYRDGAGEK